MPQARLAAQDSPALENAVNPASEEPPDDWYLGKTIKSVEFEGLKTVKKEDLAGITRNFVGKVFTEDLFFDLQSRLYELEYFDEINPQVAPASPARREVILIFAVKERPSVSKIQWQGNKGLRKSELQDAIALKVNDVVTDAKLEAAVQAIITKYIESGYPDATARHEQSVDKRGDVVVTFVVNEGEHIQVEKILFEGNKIFSERTLRSQISLKQRGFLQSGAFSRAKLLLDRQSLTQYYRDRGYIDAEVTDVTESLRTDEKGRNLVTLTFRIFEGDLYTFGGITFEGNHVFTTEELQKLVRSKVGEKVNSRVLEGDLQRVSDLYAENGYIYNNIGRVENRDSVGKVIRYTVSITERGRAHIERIIVRGNEKTKEKVILREFDLEPGDIFSKTKVMDGLRNLYNLQFFTSVYPDTPPGDADGLMDLIINVEEQPTMDIQLGVTFSGSSDPDDFPISGVVKWADRNFLGLGNTLGVDLTASFNTQALSTNYSQRWLFGLPLTGGFDFTAQHTKRTALMANNYPFFNGDEDNAYPDGFSSYEDYESSSKLPSNEYLMDYDQWYLSLGFSTGYRWTTPIGSVGLGGGVRVGLRLNTFEADLYRPFDPTIRENNGKWKPSNSLYMSTTLDQRDIYYNPSSGYFASQRFGIYGILPGKTEDEHYNQSDTDVEWYMTLWNWQVTEKWAFQGVFGIHSGLVYILPQPGYQKPLIEEANKLAIDGMFVGRGWSGERLNYGEALWKNWAEVRIPLVPGMLAWDFFFDAAEVADKPKNLFGTDEIGVSMSERMRFSYGFGLRMTLAQFPLRFLFAKRFKIVDGKAEMQPGALFRDNNDPTSGMDFVLSFALPMY